MKLNEAVKGTLGQMEELYRIWEQYDPTDRPSFSEYVRQVTRMYEDYRRNFESMQRLRSMAN